MFVRDRMSSPAVTVAADTPFQDALKLMRERRFRRLPVVDEHGVLIGIVSERDLLHAAPSPATSLSVWEVNYLLWKLKVADVMTEKVTTVSPESTLEEAAQIMVSLKIGGLPVVDDKRHVVGVVTETDIFRAFSELLGSNEHGLRLLVRVPEGRGTLAKLAQGLYELGGNILSLGTFDDGSGSHRILLLRVVGVNKDAVIKKLEEIGDELLDAREV
jgi:acetoin utilization protein AcuB